MLTYAGLAAEDAELAALASLPDFTDFPNSWTWVGANSQEMMGANLQEMTSGRGGVQESEAEEGGGGGVSGSLTSRQVFLLHL